MFVSLSLFYDTCCISAPRRWYTFKLHTSELHFNPKSDLCLLEEISLKTTWVSRWCISYFLASNHAWGSSSDLSFSRYIYFYLLHTYVCIYRGTMVLLSPFLKIISLIFLITIFDTFGHDIFVLLTMGSCFTFKGPTINLWVMFYK